MADPELSRFSGRISPVPTLPFFALSWILTLFSHDVDTLEPIQRIFDYLLSRNPISAIYLAVAILVAKKGQMLRLVKEMGQEAIDDPSILHPLFSRLPPLLADTPIVEDSTRQQEKEMEAKRAERSLDDVNPYSPITLSSIFAVADDLMARFPWDGPAIRGREVFAEASSVITYSLESTDPAWSLHRAGALAHGEVVRPGAGFMDDDSEEEDENATPAPIRRRPRSRLRIPRDKVGTLVAVGIVLVGIGIAVYGSRSGGPRSNWAKWWSTVLRDVASRRGSVVSRFTESLHSWTTKTSEPLRRLLARVIDIDR